MNQRNRGKGNQLQASEPHGRRSPNTKEEEQAAGVLTERRNPGACGQGLDDEVAWVSEVSDSSGSYSCLQLTRVLNIHHPEKGNVFQCPEAKLRLFCLIRR